MQRWQQQAEGSKQQQLVHRAEPARFDLVNFNYNLRCVSVCVCECACMSVCVSKSSTRRLPLGKAWHRKYVNHNKRHLPCLPPPPPPRSHCSSAESSSALAVALLLGSAASLVLGTHKARALAAANRKLKISARLHIKKFLSPSPSLFLFLFLCPSVFLYIYIFSFLLLVCQLVVAASASAAVFFICFRLVSAHIQADCLAALSPVYFLLYCFALCAHTVKERSSYQGGHTPTRTLTHTHPY